MERKETVICKICGYITTNHQSFNSHIVHAHGINSKEYYDSYLKTEVDGLCKTCGKPTKFHNMWKGYRSFCCDSCMSSNKAIQQQRKQTSLNHYGVEFPHQAQEVKEQVAKTNLDRFGAENVYASDYGKTKIKETLVKKYGVDNVAKLEDVKRKAQNTCIKKYGVSSPGQAESVKSKIKQTNLDRYGVDVPAKCQKVVEKTKQTCMTRYGVVSSLNLSNVRKRTMETAYTHEARSKARKTAQANGNNSKLEDYLEHFFITNNIKYKTEYNLDSRYPYHCDFYLPKYDMFIEINNYWTHNTHFFNPDNLSDIATLNKWKSKNSPQYIAAIKTWTITDIEKRNTAIKNKIHYVVLWNKLDIDNFINSFIK